MFFGNLSIHSTEILIITLSWSFMFILQLQQVSTGLLTELLIIDV